MAKKEKEVPKKKMSVIMADTIRALVEYAVDNNVDKDDLVSLMKEDEHYVLVFYK